MRKFTLIAAALLTGLACGAALAAGGMKPGLWEMTVKSDAMKGMAMPALSPEQMEMMRKAGVSMPQMQDGGMVTKACITKEMAERDHPPQMERNDAGCQVRNYQRRGNTFSADMVCDSPGMKGTGRVTGTYVSDVSFTSATDFEGTVEGRPMKQRHESNGRWLAADCGAVKPPVAIGKK